MSVSNPDGPRYGPWRDLGARSISDVTVTAIPWGCMRCARRGVETQTTYFNDRSRGMFPLCRACWAELGSPKERLPFYAMLWAIWVGQDPQRIDSHITDWRYIEDAVLAGG